MRRLLRDLPLQSKITAVIASTTAAALLLASVAFLAHEVLTYRRTLVEELTALARVTGASSTAALAFDDRRSARETLGALAGEAQVLRAELYDRDGRLFASYPEAPRPEEQGLPGGVADPTHRFTLTQVEVTHPVLLDGEVQGAVRLQASLEPLRAKFRRLLAIVALSLTLSLLAAYALSRTFGRVLSQPILELARTTRRVSAHGDYSVRATPAGRDELGSLVEGFNHMLAQIQARDEELRRLAAAVEQAAEAVVVTDPGWHIQYVNPAFERVTGYSRAEAVGRHIRLLRSGEEQANLFAEIEERVSGGAPWSGHLVNRRKDGTLYEEECTVSPVRSETGRLVSYVALKRDVTHEVRLEQSARQSQKLEALGTLAGGIAHDFNNVLAPILGFTELAAEDLPEGHPARGHLNRVLAAAERARDLVRQILAFSRRGEQERHPVHLVPVLEEALQLVRATLPRTIELRTGLDRAADLVVADPTQLHQVVLNLCTNAWHAMGDQGGVLEVTLAPASPAELQGQPALTGGAYLCLAVRDTGCGIPPEVVDRIFEPFFTTKPVGEGTGLGLAAVHGIVRSHGGAVAVETRPAAGSVFRVYLPLAAADAAARIEDVGGAPRGRGTVLFVDDEEAIAELGKRALEGLGYRVVAVTDSRQALELFRADPARFDLVVTDQTMPGLTGDALARELLARRPDLPVLLCTGHSRTVDPERARELGIRQFLTKPVTVGELARAVRAALEGPPG